MGDRIPVYYEVAAREGEGLDWADERKNDTHLSGRPAVHVQLYYTNVNLLCQSYLSMTVYGKKYTHSAVVPSEYIHTGMVYYTLNLPVWFKEAIYFN